MAKQDLVDEANALGIELTGDETVSQLEELIAAKKAANDEEQGGDTDETASQVSRRLNRGNRRRIVRALTELDKALVSFTKEIDRVVYPINEKGERGEGRYHLLPFIDDVRNDVRDEINKVLAQS